MNFLDFNNLLYESMQIQQSFQETFIHSCEKHCGHHWLAHVWDSYRQRLVNFRKLCSVMLSCLSKIKFGFQLCAFVVQQQPNKLQSVYLMFSLCQWAELSKHSRSSHRKTGSLAVLFLTYCSFGILVNTTGFHCTNNESRIQVQVTK